MTAQGLGLLDPTNCWKIRANSQYTDKEFPYCCVTHWNHCQHNWIRCQDTKRPWIVGPRKAGPNALLQGINKYQKKKIAWIDPRCSTYLRSSIQSHRSFRDPRKTLLAWRSKWIKTCESGCWVSFETPTFVQLRLKCTMFHDQGLKDVLTLPG